MTETHGLKIRRNALGKFDVYLDEPGHFLHSTTFAGNLATETEAAKIISVIGALIEQPAPEAAAIRAFAEAAGKGQLL